MPVAALVIGFARLASSQSLSPSDTPLPGRVPASLVFFLAAEAVPEDGALAEPEARGALFLTYKEVSGAPWTPCNEIGQDPVGLQSTWNLLWCASGGDPTSLPRPGAGSRPGVVGLADRAKAARVLAGTLARFAGDTRPRIISDKGSLVLVVVLEPASGRTLSWTPSDAARPADDDPVQTGATCRVTLVEGAKPAVTVDEQARSTRFSADISALARLAVVVSTARQQDERCGRLPDKGVEQEAVPAVTTWVRAYPYSLRLVRGTITLTVSAGGKPVVLASDALATDNDAAQGSIESAPREGRFEVAGQSGGDGGRLRGQASVDQAVGEAGQPLAGSAGVGRAMSASAPTGPAEHLFLSADVALGSQPSGAWLTTDSKGALVVDEPPSFYIGFNFLLGDIATDRRTFTENLVLKLFIAASRHPHDSVGVGIGLRGHYLKRLGIDLDLLSPYVGWTSTARQPRGSGPRSQQWRLGVSVNIDRALAWTR